MYLLLAGAVVIIGIVLVVWLSEYESPEARRERELADLRARHARASYELNKAAFETQRAISNALADARRSRRP